jgi:hypothetical protein
MSPSRCSRSAIVSVEYGGGAGGGAEAGSITVDMRNPQQAIGDY